MRLAIFVAFAVSFVSSAMASTAKQSETQEIGLFRRNVVIKQPLVRQRAVVVPQQLIVPQQQLIVPQQQSLIIIPQ